MEAETVLETSKFHSLSTWKIDWEDLIAFSYYEVSYFVYFEVTSGDFLWGVVCALYNVPVLFNPAIVSTFTCTFKIGS